MTALRVTLAFLCACLSSTSAQLVWSSVTDSTSLQSGEGTFYGEGQDSQGTCSFSANFANTNDLPWSSGTDLTVALNDAQFAESSACGMCIRFRGSGAGLGTTPIPSTWTNAIVNNRCPECAKGDVDLASAGDGRWKIQWYAVPCEVGNTPLHYSIVVSSYYWFSMVVSNTRVPITGVSVNIGGTWLVLKRSVNNQWAYYNTNGPWQSSFPMGVRVTSIEGQTVEDVITSVTGNVGTKQFSADGSSSGTSAVSSTPTTGSSVPPASGTAAQPPVSAGSVPPPVPAVPVPPPVAASPPVSATPPAPSAPLTDGGFYIENYQQCGGNGGACNNKPYTAAPCGDAAWTSAVCRNQNFACVRASAELYTCVPGVRGVPPPVGSTPPPVGSTPPPVGSTPPPQPAAATPPPVQAAAATPPPVQAAAQASPPVGSTPPPQQAQQYGIQLASPQSPPPTPTATSTPTPTEQQYGIQPANQTPQSPPTPTPTPTSAQASGSGSPPPTPYAATSPPPTPTQQASSAASSSSLAISAGGQCGGTSQCEPAGTPTDKVTCTNGPWAGAYCPNSYECKANPGPLVWTCMPSSSATAGRRLLDGR